MLKYSPTFWTLYINFQMDLLYIAVIGKKITLTPNKWYLMFEKIVDEYDGCECEISERKRFQKDLIRFWIFLGIFLQFSAVPFSKERKIFNEKMIQRYLTPEQTKRLKIFSQTIASRLNQNDVKVLMVSWN